MIEFQQYLSFTKDVLLIITILTGAYLSIKLFRKFTPVIAFKITPEWSMIHPGIVILKIEIENKSKVEITVDNTAEDKFIRFKTIRHNASTTTHLTEWLDIKDSEVICKTTRCLYPSEIIKIDRLERCENGEILQGIIQFNAKFSTKQKFLVDNSVERWTSTFIILR